MAIGVPFSEGQFDKASRLISCVPALNAASRIIRTNSGIRVTDASRQDAALKGFGSAKVWLPMGRRRYPDEPRESTLHACVAPKAAYSSKRIFDLRVRRTPGGYHKQRLTCRDSRCHRLMQVSTLPTGRINVNSAVDISRCRLNTQTGSGSQATPIAFPIPFPLCAPASGHGHPWRRGREAHLTRFGEYHERPAGARRRDA